MTETKITPRFKTKYAEVVVPALQEEFKYENVMQTPKIVKVVVNMGCRRGSSRRKAHGRRNPRSHRNHRSEADCYPR